MRIVSEDILNKWKEFTLMNDHGMSVSILNYGGVITKIIVPDQDGKMENVVLSYKNYEDYEENPNYFGATVGRVAGRIQDASFKLDGETFSLNQNENEHHIHGGKFAFNHVIWASEVIETDETVSLVLSHHSKDGENGYPGNVDLKITFSLNNDNDFCIDYHAISDKKTALALTNHAYFNLSGNNTDTIKDHYVTINSDRFVELNAELIPTGHILNVEGTPFDFRAGRLLSDGMVSTHEQNKIANHGYDHYFIFNQGDEGLINVMNDLNGRTLTVKTNQPGVVMYTANSLKKGINLAEGESEQYSGVCFETQGSPASLHHEGFPSIIIEANQPYSKYTEFSFNTKQSL